MATPIFFAHVRIAVLVAASSRPVTCVTPHFASRSSCWSARNCGPVSPAVPFDVGQPHGQFVPSLGGTGFGCVSESRAAVRLPIAKADPEAGAAPLLVIGALTLDEVLMLEPALTSVLVLIVGLVVIVGAVVVFVFVSVEFVFVEFVLTGLSELVFIVPVEF